MKSPHRATRTGALAAALALTGSLILADAWPALAVRGPAMPVGCPVSAPRPAADAYLDALVSHDASAVPLAPDVRRVENGLVTGRSDQEIRADLDSSIKYRIITGLRKRTYTPLRTGVRVHYLLDVGVGATRILTVQVTERFDVHCGMIEFIRADIRPE